MKNKLFYLIAIFIFGITLILIIIFKKEERKEILPLKANVNYNSDEKKFVIKNIDTIDFVHADVAIDNYYKLRDINLIAGETYTIWQVEFLHYNGTHYPLKFKPRIFSIWCEINNEGNGFYSKKIR